jgi:hypothetical protein
MNRRLFFLALAPVLVSVGWLAAAEPPIIGSWDCTSTTPMGTDMKWTLTVKEQDGKLTGTAGSDEGDMPISEAKLEGGEFSFKVLVDSESYSVRIKVEGAKFQGTWTGGGETGAITGVKKKI